MNSQQIHMSVEDCTNVQLARLSITAPGTSPNTDGIHITRSKDVRVTDCKIKTGKLKVQDSLHMEYIIFKLSVNLDLLH
jgi:polygalacturonase